MKLYNTPAPQDWPEILKRPVISSGDLESIVEPVLLDVKNQGDEALFKYTEKFDQVKLSSLKVSDAEIDTACQTLDSNLKDAIRVAAVNIEKFHKAQVQTKEVIETYPGVKCWRESRPIEKVGLYIPGGTAPLFSTILMLVIPAQIAGCKEIILCTPPDKQGNVHPAILFAAQHVGVTQIFKVGGAQAIAAMTFGTESIPAVYKIFGPGNQYVTCAKQMATKYGVSIDMPAGPSEVQVIADQSANPQFIASDLLSQAEHGIDSQVILVCTSESIADEVALALKAQLDELPRREFAQKALDNSKVIILEDRQTIIDITNEYGPEHLIIQTDDYEDFIEHIINAGSVFLGHYTPESAGDYASGTNHTLPTNGYAKMYSGVSLDSYVKKITFQEISKEGIKGLGPIIETMAGAEELHAHKNAVTLRLSSILEKA